MMNIFNKVALEGMKKSRTRTFVTVIGVILSTTMITAIATFAISLQHYMINGSFEKSGNWHVAFTDASFIKSCKQDKQVKRTAAVKNIGYAILDGCKINFKNIITCHYHSSNRQLNYDFNFSLPTC